MSLSRNDILVILFVLGAVSASSYMWWQRNVKVVNDYDVKLAELSSSVKVETPPVAWKNYCKEYLTIGPYSVTWSKFQMLVQLPNRINGIYTEKGVFWVTIFELDRGVPVTYYYQVV